MRILKSLMIACLFFVVIVPIQAEEEPPEVVLNDDEENDDAEEEAKKIITVNRDAFSVEEFSSAQMETTINLEAGTYTLTIANSNPAVATVSQSGLISALAPGETTITILVNVNDSTISYTRIIPVTVYSITGSISFESAETVLSRGSYFDIAYTLSTEALSNRDIIWTSSNPSVATVVNGRVTGVKVGTTTVTATIGSISASMTVRIVVPLTQIEFNPSSLEMEVGQSMPIPTLIYVPYDTTDAKKPNYEVENEDIVSVTDGSIRALAIGKTFIYARINDIEAVLDINVIPQTTTLEAQQLPLSIVRSTEEEIVLSVDNIASYQGNRFQFILPIETVKRYVQSSGKTVVTIICDDYLIRDNWTYFSGMTLDKSILEAIEADLEIRFVDQNERIQVMYRFSESYDKSINLRFTLRPIEESSRYYSELTSPGYSLRFYNTEGFPARTHFSINPSLLNGSESKIHILYLIENRQLVDTQQEVKQDTETGTVHFLVSDNAYVITFTKIGVNTYQSVITLLSFVLVSILLGISAHYFKRYKQNK